MFARSFFVAALALFAAASPIPLDVEAEVEVNVDLAVFGQVALPTTLFGVCEILKAKTDILLPTIDSIVASAGVNIDAQVSVVTPLLAELSVVVNAATHLLVRNKDCTSGAEDDVVAALVAKILVDVNVTLDSLSGTCFSPLVLKVQAAVTVFLNQIGAVLPSVLALVIRLLGNVGGIVGGLLGGLTSAPCDCL